MDDATGYTQFVRASLTVVSTIRTTLSWNRVCDKKDKNKKMNKLQFSYLLVLCLVGVYYTRWGIAMVANAQGPQASLSKC